MKLISTFFNKITKILTFLFVFILIFCFFAGCDFNKGYVSGGDGKVDMRPRLITATAGEFEDMIENVVPAVVGISAVYSNVESVGSGVAIAPNGYIVTNDHVVSGAKDITVYFADKTSAKASVVWKDSSMDLAIIKTDVNMPYLEVNSGDMKVGADVVAIGTPLTLQFKHTTTKGIISALNRTVEVDNTDGSVSYLQNLIQHDSSINPGNSGGPLINASGQVVGINTLKVSDAEGLGFAIPINVIVPVMNKILKNGSYETPYLGMFGFDATIAKFYDKTLETDGVYVLNIDINSPIYKAGVREGDIVAQIDNTKTNTMLDLRTSVYNYEVGDNARVVFIRNNQKLEGELTFTERP